MPEIRQNIILIIFAVLLAIGLDVVLTLWARKHKAGEAVKEKPEGGVYLFGAFSPVLTWIHQRSAPVWQRVKPRANVENKIWEAVKGLPAALGRLNVTYGAWIDSSFLTLAVVIYTSGILRFDLGQQLPGNEALVFQMLDWTLWNSLVHYRSFPLWNPYIYTGIPYLGDPMSHVFNPLVTIPVLLMGVVSGFKVGIFLSFLTAAFGARRLGKVLGFGRPVQFWLALMFVFAGQPAARFFQGQYLFVLGFAWIPWIISSLLLLKQKKKIQNGVELGVFLALLFLSGNIYYAAFLVFVCIIFGLIYFPKFSRTKPFIKVEWKLFLLMCLAAVVALGLSSVQLLPQLEVREHIVKATDIQGSHSLGQIILDLTSTDNERFDAYSEMPAREEFYAYIGWFPIFALATVLFALRNPNNRKPVLFFACVLLFGTAWISVKRLSFGEVLVDTYLFHQLRHLLRILILVSMAVIVLAGFGLDAILKRLQTSKMPEPGKPTWKIYPYLARLGVLIVLAGLVLSAWEVFRANKDILSTQESNLEISGAMNWLASSDHTNFYVRFNPSNAGYEEIISNNLRNINSWYHFDNPRNLDNNLSVNEITAEPKYVVQSSDEPLEDDDGVIVRQINGYDIYRKTQSLPFGYFVTEEWLSNPAPSRLMAKDVEEVPVFLNGTDEIEIITEGGAGKVLVLSVNRLPGWELTIDGEPAEILNTGGYLSTIPASGVHKYVFSYKPDSVVWGTWISVVTLLGVVGVSIWQSGLSRKGILRFIRSVGPRVKGLFQRTWPETEPVPVPRAAASARGATLVAEQTVPRDIPVVQINWNMLRASLDRLMIRLRAWNLATWLFVGALALYTFSRLYQIASFPIYFFTDEAVQTVMASDFINSGFKNYSGELLPLYFSKGSSFNLSCISVYLQVIPYLLFGKSVEVTRGVSALVSVLAPLFVGLTLKNVFKSRHWWLGALLLSIVPAWFLHSRTAFETVEMVGFYAGFLYCYLMYRTQAPKYLYPALVFGALVFYTYSPGQLIIGLTGVLLFISDLPYHLKNRKTLLFGFLLLILLAAPYAVYVLKHPEVTIQHLSTRAPYWTADIPLVEKLRTYFGEYLYGLSPGYWFISNSRDLERHLMKGFGHFLIWMLPFAVFGLLYVLRKIASPQHRAVLITLLVAPSGAALVGIGVTRALVFVVPATILITLGLSIVLKLIEKSESDVDETGIEQLRRKVHPKWPERGISQKPLMLVLFAILAIVNLSMLRTALTDGPTWFTNYTLYGMQWGARQVFGAVQEYLVEYPEASIMVNPDWTNGSDAVASFFVGGEERVNLGSISGHYIMQEPLDENKVFVITSEQLVGINESGKFKEVVIDEDYTIFYPNGEPGFYFVKLAYVDNIEEIFLAEREERKVLQVATVDWNGVAVDAKYSLLDSGEIGMIFDGDLESLVRTMEANPMILELRFPTPQKLSGITARLGSIDAEVTVYVYSPGTEEAQVFSSQEALTVNDPEIDVDFGEMISVEWMRLEMHEPEADEYGHIHLWELVLKAEE